MGDERPYLAKGQRLLEKYEIVQDINTGSFGHVVMCRDVTDNGRKVAVKVQDRSETRYHQGYTCVGCSLSSVLHKMTVATIVCVLCVSLSRFITLLHVARVLVYFRCVGTKISRSRSTFWSRFARGPSALLPSSTCSNTSNTLEDGASPSSA